MFILILEFPSENEKVSLSTQTDLCLLLNVSGLISPFIINIQDFGALDFHFCQAHPGAMGIDSLWTHQTKDEVPGN